MDFLKLINEDGVRDHDQYAHLNGIAIYYSAKDGLCFLQFGKEGCWYGKDLNLLSQPFF